MEHGKAWGHWPWRFYKSPLETLRVQPSFATCEWTYRFFALACALHASKTKNWQLFFSSFICGSCNDAFFMAGGKYFADAFWQSSNYSIGITPRMPLYIIEMYAVIMYTSTTAARRWNLPYVSEAALTGLLAHFLYGTYDINGPRYLWWTWHDLDPTVGVRRFNAPIGSSVWILTYCALHAALNRWMNDSSTSVEKHLVEPAMHLFETLSLRRLPMTLASLALSMAKSFDVNIRSRLLRAPSFVKIAVTGMVCTPMFMTMMGQLQMASLDVIGIPGYRTYRFTLALYTVILARAALLKQFAPKELNLPTREANFDLLRWVTAFYAMQLTVSLLGKPRAHQVTGCHQLVGPKGSHIATDLMGFERDDACQCSDPEHGGPPERNSRFDYDFVGPQEQRTFDANGQRIIPADPNDKVAREWYTIRGKDHLPQHGGRMAEFIGIAVFALLGTVGYGAGLST